MKLVRLRIRAGSSGGGQGGEGTKDLEVAFHPQITVVLGAAGPVRTSLIEAIAGIPRGAARARGLIEVDGVRQDLTAASLAALGLSTDVDVVVRAGQLPGSRSGIDERTAARRAAAAATDEARRSLRKARAVSEDAHEALDAVKRELVELRSGGDGSAHVLDPSVTVPPASPAVDEPTNAEQARLDAEIERLSSERDAAISARGAAEVALAEARGQAEQRDEADAGSAPPEQTAPDQRITEMEASRDDLERHLVALTSQDPTLIKACLDRIERARTADPVEIPAAVAFADAWRDVHEQLADLERTESIEEREARARLDKARSAAVEAEQDLRVTGLPIDLVAELETAHSAVLDAQDKSASRFSGARARSRLDHARDVERGVLAKLNFTTYADYMMSSSSRGVGAGKRAVLQTARIRVAEAEAELQALSDTARDIWRADLIEQRSALAPRIALLLGRDPEGPDVEAELRALRAVPPADDATLADMRSLLAGVGVEVEDELLGQDELVGLARTWLDENAHMDERRAAIEAELHAIDHELGDRSRVPVGGGTRVPAARVGKAPAAPARSARVRIDAPAASEARRRQAESSVERAELQLADVQGKIGDLEAAVAAAEAARAELLEGDDRTGEQPPADVASAEETDTSAERALAEAEVRLERASQDALAAQLEVDRLSAELASAEYRHSALLAAERDTDEEEARPTADVSADRQEAIADIEWYLLTRLAAAQSVGSAGSVPLVLDDTFHDLEVPEAVAFMEWIERMSAAVQVIAVTDDLALSFWADSLGGDRAAVVSLGT